MNFLEIGYASLTQAGWTPMGLKVSFEERLIIYIYK